MKFRLLQRVLAARRSAHASKPANTCDIPETVTLASTRATRNSFPNAKDLTRYRNFFVIRGKSGSICIIQKTKQARDEPMEEILTGVSWLAVIVGAVVSFVAGWAWYSEKMFGKK